MAVITDAMMNERLQHTRAYTAVILRPGPNYGAEGARAIIWEHGRRNMSLREDGYLSIVCPISDDSEVCGIGIFDADPEEVRGIMEGDPAVRAGVLAYEVHPCRGFPGDRLPV
ncbi:MAG TPA: hypothetical protein VFC04_03545 [Actinomycetota bacterium]|nr:hypothetical protein [Actinomycetota bacterium]